MANSRDLLPSGTMTPLHATGDGMKTIAQARAWLAATFHDAVGALRGDVLIERMTRMEGGRWIYHGPDRSVEWDLPAPGRVIVVGAGKAVTPLAAGLERQLGERLDHGCIVSKYGHTEPLHRIRQFEGGHPIPDANGLLGTQALLDTLSGLTAQDRVFVLITGGASALMAAPAAPLSLDDEALVNTLLVRSRAAIEEINTVRQAMSAVKGGRLLERIAPAQCLCLLVSDIPSEDISKIGSGPVVPSVQAQEPALAILRRHGLAECLPDHVLRHFKQADSQAPLASKHPAEVIVLADSAALVRAVEAKAARDGIAVLHVDLRMSGDTHHAARAFAAAMKHHARQGTSDRPCLFVAAGETTLEVTGSGLGGRNQEFALVAAQELAGVEGCVVLAAGSDGTDGPTSAAGGFADGTTQDRASRSGFAIKTALADNDSHRLLEALGDLHITGPTGTNVMDLVLGLVI